MMPELRGLHVLVVDDDADGREMLVELFVMVGATVQQAEAPAAALAILATVNPDVLISDIAMPGQDGYWLMQRVRSLTHLEKRAVPAIALSAFTAEGDRHRAFAAGFDRHVAKPVDPHGLITTVTEVVRARSGLP
jgi:CheY-like chemotaxis protein